MNICKKITQYICISLQIFLVASPSMAADYVSNKEIKSAFDRVRITLTPSDTWPIKLFINDKNKERGIFMEGNAYERFLNVKGSATYGVLTSDALHMMFCHEFGHFRELGGAPFMAEVGKSSFGSFILTVAVDGQADYFASSKCFREVFKNEDNISFISTLSVPPLVREKCSSVFHDPKESALCQRNAMSGFSLMRFNQSWLKQYFTCAESRSPKEAKKCSKNAEFYANYVTQKGSTVERENSIAVDFETPSQFEIGETDVEHPLPQCRLDTLFAGALCNQPSDIRFSKASPNTGACSKINGHDTGVRPSCWFKENLDLNIVSQMAGKFSVPKNNIDGDVHDLSLIEFGPLNAEDPYLSPVKAVFQRNGVRSCDGFYHVKNVKPPAQNLEFNKKIFMSLHCTSMIPAEFDLGFYFRANDLPGKNIILLSEGRFLEISR